MTPDDLQRWASALRWTGLIVTAVGVMITVGSHYIADRLSVTQRSEKLKAEERLRSSDIELQATKAKTEELEKTANVIHSMELRVALAIPTEPRSLTSVETDVGLQNVVAFFTADKTRIRLVTDFKVADQQVTDRLRKLTFVYQPETPTEIYGRPIDYLTKIDTFACRLDEILKQEKAEFAGSGTLDITLLVNGVEVVTLRDQLADPALLMNQQAILPVADAFRRVPETYTSRLRERRQN